MGKEGPELYARTVERLAYMRAHNSKVVKNDKLNKKKEIYMLQDIT